MRRVALIVLVATVYLGCAKSRPVPVEPPEPIPEPIPEAIEALPGGRLRIALPGSALDVRTRDALEALWASRGEALLEGIDVILSERIGPDELLLLGEADLAVLHGRKIDRLRQTGEFEFVRAPGWDRTYSLLCDAAERWTHDPNFRRWLAGTIDRRDLAERLFGAAAQPALALGPDVTEPRWAPPLVQPFGPTSRPVLDLAYDLHDEAARSIGARLKAAFAVEGMELRLLDGAGDERPELTLVAYQRFAEDRLDTISRMVPADAAGARWYLRQARAADGEGRASLVALAEDALLIDARLIPVVRLDAWIAFVPGLQGVEPGWSGELPLERIGWVR